MEVQFGIVCFLSNQKENKNEKELINYNYKIIIYGYISNVFKICISVQIMIIPILVYNYHTVSLTFFITNILTSFLIALIIMFGFLIIIISFFSFEFSKILGVIYKLLIKLLLIITEKTSKLPFSKIYLKTPYLFEIIIYYVLIIIIIYYYNKFRKGFFNQENQKLLQN